MLGSLPQQMMIQARMPKALLRLQLQVCKEEQKVLQFQNMRIRDVVPPPVSCLAVVGTIGAVGFGRSEILKMNCGDFASVCTLCLVI